MLFFPIHLKINQKLKWPYSSKKHYRRSAILPRRDVPADQHRYSREFRLHFHYQL
jgi:hypothetical protein